MQVRKFSKIASSGAGKFDVILSRSKFGLLGKALASTLVLGLGQTAGAVDVAPYFHYWSGSLVTAKNVAGMDSTTLAFAVTRGSCALDIGFQQKLPDARNYVNAGGKLLISFGGADGVYAEIACKDDNQLFALIEKVMNDSGSRRIDFDVEGHQLLNTEGTARRSRVLARLQAKYPDMYVSFSLPAWLRGFDTNSMNLLKVTAAAGVRIDMVNMMAQSFGVGHVQSLVPATVAQAAITAFRASALQIGTIYPNKTQTQINAMMGITPMIGTNDDGSTFTLADAQTVANFAKVNGVGLLSYWSFQRDRAQSRAGITPLNDYSGVAQANYQFHSIFKSA
ncbi:MAG: Chitinase, partial [Polaromonas sp.]|nr:Chitinase [Polaromonas sp.]